MTPKLYCYKYKGRSIGHHFYLHQDCKYHCTGCGEVTTSKGRDIYPHCMSVDGFKCGCGMITLAGEPLCDCGWEAETCYYTTSISPHDIKNIKNNAKIK